MLDSVDGCRPPDELVREASPSFSTKKAQFTAACRPSGTTPGRQQEIPGRRVGNHEDLNPKGSDAVLPRHLALVALPPPHPHRDRSPRSRSHPMTDPCGPRGRCPARRTIPRPPKRVEAAIGLGGVVFCPFKGRGEPQWKKDASSEPAKLRQSDERAITQLKNQAVPHRLLTRPARSPEPRSSSNSQRQDEKG